jgi:hypothetical protein
MRLAFIDDSTQTTSRRKGLGELIAVGGVIVPGGEVAGYATELTAIRADLGVPADAELKSKPPRGSFLGGADRDLIGGLRQRMLQAAVDRGFCSVVVVWIVAE